LKAETAKHFWRNRIVIKNITERSQSRKATSCNCWTARQPCAPEATPKKIWCFPHSSVKKQTKTQRVLSFFLVKNYQQNDKRSREVLSYNYLAMQYWPANVWQVCI